MKYIILIFISLCLFSCTLPITGTNQFNRIYKGMDKSDARFSVKDRPDFSNKLLFENQNFDYDVYLIHLTTYTEKRRENRPNFLGGTDAYDVTETTSYSYPYVILYLDNKVYFQGFIWEFKSNINPKIYGLGEALRREINV